MEEKDFKSIVIMATGAILILIVVAGFVLSFAMMCSADSINAKRPILTDSKIGDDQTAKKAQIANYNDLVSAAQKQSTNIYDFFVIKTLLPVFQALIASVLTYIFTKTAYKCYLAYLDKRKV